MTHAELAALCLKYGHTLPADLPHNRLYRLCHHEVLFEFVFNPYERIEYIVTMKPEHERTTRLREFVPIPFSVGDAKAMADYNKAMADYNKAMTDYNKEMADYNKAMTDYNKAMADHDKAMADYNKAMADHDKAMADYNKEMADYNKAMADHDKARDDFDKSVTPTERTRIVALVPDTKWNGSTIFPDA